VTGRFIFERPTYQFADASDIGQVQIAVGLARGADTDEREFCLVNCFVLIVRGPKTTRSHCLSDDFPDFGLDDRGLAGVYQVNLGTDRIYADYFMTIVGQAPGRHRSDIAHPEDTDLHLDFLSPVA
jgi:hypothetical protein